MPSLNLLRTHFTQYRSQITESRLALFSLSSLVLATLAAGWTAGVVSVQHGHLDTPAGINNLLMYIQVCKSLELRYSDHTLTRLALADFFLALCRRG